MLTIEQVEFNEMKKNTEKCYLFTSGNKFEQMWPRIRDEMIWQNRTVKLLGITIDNELKSDEQLTNTLLLNSFFESKFKYCPLTWMFYSRKTNNSIRKLHERALRLVYGDYESRRFVKDAINPSQLFIFITVIRCSRLPP